MNVTNQQKCDVEAVEELKESLRGYFSTEAEFEDCFNAFGNCSDDVFLDFIHGEKTEQLTAHLSQLARLEHAFEFCHEQSNSSNSRAC